MTTFFTGLALIFIGYLGGYSLGYQQGLRAMATYAARQNKKIVDEIVKLLEQFAKKAIEK